MLIGKKKILLIIDIGYDSIDDFAKIYLLITS